MSRARNLADLLQGGTVVPSTKLATLTGSNMPTGTVLQCLSSHSLAMLVLLLAQLLLIILL
jgi:hypothetical protein